METTSFVTFGISILRSRLRDILRYGCELFYLEKYILISSKPLSLGLFRSDYMVHQDTSTSTPSLQVKQVEFNTIASSFGGLSTYTSALHK